MIAPTFGFGNWDKAGQRGVRRRRRPRSARHAPAGPQAVYLMGYSNGAMGVTRAAIQEPRLFRGLIYLSPVTEDEFSRPRRSCRMPETARFSSCTAAATSGFRGAWSKGRSRPSDGSGATSV